MKLEQNAYFLDLENCYKKLNFSKSQKKGLQDNSPDQSILGYINLLWQEENFPVSTRRRFDVYTTSITLKRRRMDVKTTLCAYWVGVFFNNLPNFSPAKISEKIKFPRFGQRRPVHTYW